jgi:hypothetical protein
MFFMLPLRLSEELLVYAFTELATLALVAVLVIVLFPAERTALTVISVLHAAIARLATALTQTVFFALHAAATPIRGTTPRRIATA